MQTIVLSIVNKVPHTRTQSQFMEKDFFYIDWSGHAIEILSNFNRKNSIFGFDAKNWSDWWMMCNEMSILHVRNYSIHDFINETSPIFVK